MQVKTTPGWNHYNCTFTAYIGQGGHAPITLEIVRGRDEKDEAELVLKVGEVQVVKTNIDISGDAAALAELFTRARLYVFPPREEEK